MSLTEFVATLPEHHRAHKEYKELVSAACDATADRVASNLEVIVGVHRRVFSAIRRLCDEAGSVHPEHEDSYPPTLKAIEEVEEADRRAMKG